VGRAAVVVLASRLDSDDDDEDERCVGLTLYTLLTELWAHLS